MIARVRGTLLVREMDRAEVMTAAGIAYEIHIPLSVYEKLPRVGEEVEFRTLQVIREDAHPLFGFLEEAERTVFSRLLGASGVGPRLALAMLSSLSAERLVRAIRDRDVAALTTVSGVGRKTAERLVLDLGGKLGDIALAPGGGGARVPGMEEAIRALSVLGFPIGDAERAVHAAAHEAEPMEAQELIRAALTHLR